MKKSIDRLMGEFIVKLSNEKYNKYIRAALQNDELVLKEFDKEFEEYCKSHSEDKEN